MSSFGNQSHDTMLRQAFYNFCSFEDTSDMRLVGDDGIVNCHKIVILKVFPNISTILCSTCDESHDPITIIFPNVSVKVLKKARDDLYLFGDISAIETLFKAAMEVNSEYKIDIESLNDDTDSTDVECLNTNRLSAISNHLSSQICDENEG